MDIKGIPSVELFKTVPDLELFIEKLKSKFFIYFFNISAVKLSIYDEEIKDRARNGQIPGKHIKNPVSFLSF